MRRNIGFSIYATSTCNRCCLHCSQSAFHSQPPVHFSKKMAEDLMESAKTHDRRITIYITGGGEPLMSPELVPVVETFIKDSQVRRVSMVTSSFLSKDLDDKKRLEDLISLQIRNKLALDISFNCFNSTFPERLGNFLKVFIRSSEIETATLRFCVSLTNFGKTFNDSAKVLEAFEEEFDLEIRGHMVDFRSEGYKRELHLFNERFFKEKRLDYLTLEAYYIPTVFAVYKDSKIIKAIRVFPFPLIRNGKGRAIKDRLMGNGFCCETMLKTDMNYLHVNFNGTYFPQCGCAQFPEMKIGEIGDNIDEVLERKSLLAQKLMEKMLSSKKMFPKNSIACDFCPAFMKDIAF